MATECEAFFGNQYMLSHNRPRDREKFFNKLVAFAAERGRMMVER